MEGCELKTAAGHEAQHGLQPAAAATIMSRGG